MASSALLAKPGALAAKASFGVRCHETSSLVSCKNVTYVGLWQEKRLRSSVRIASPPIIADRCRFSMQGGYSAPATLTMVNFEGSSLGKVVLDLKIAKPETAKAVVHRGVITEMQNRRKGTASTLTRSEVRGGGRKPFKQKGTGQARMGSRRTPLRPGGGVVFGPKPKDWRIKINKKEKRLAISTAIQSASVNTLVVEDFEDKMTVPKTKEFVALLNRWGLKPEENIVLFSQSLPDALVLASRNIARTKLLVPRNLNLYDILKADKVILTKSGLDYLNGAYPSVSVDEEEEEEAETAEGEEVATA